MRYWWIASAQKVEVIVRHAHAAGGRIVNRKPIDGGRRDDHEEADFGVPSVDDSGFIPACMRIAVLIDAPYAVFFNEVEDALDHLSADESLEIDLRANPIEVRERFGQGKGLVAIRTHVAAHRFERSAAPALVLEALRAACVMNMPPWVARRRNKGVLPRTVQPPKTRETVSSASSN